MILISDNPFAWERCDHSGIGLPGCPTCDPDKSRCLQRARYVTYREVEAEREACAALMEWLDINGTDDLISANEAAAAIRNRGKT